MAIRKAALALASILPVLAGCGSSRDIEGSGAERGSWTQTARDNCDKAIAQAKHAEYVADILVDQAGKSPADQDMMEAAIAATLIAGEKADLAVRVCAPFIKSKPSALNF